MGSALWPERGSGNFTAGEGIDITNDVISVVPTVHITTLLAASNTIEVTGLDPATDGDYDFRAEIVINANNATVKLQPNGADTNAWSICGDWFVGAVRNDTTWTLGYFGANPKQFTAPHVLVIVGRLYAKVGRRRYGDFRFYLQSGAGVNTAGHFECYWNDTATALASLKMVSAVANGYAIGSFMQLTAVRQPA